jgi:ABC-type antimicrobial peptide transport system permease subunit
MVQPLDKSRLFIGSLTCTIVFEVVTIAARLLAGFSAGEFNATEPHVLLQVHHMFWSLPIIAIGVVLALLKKPSEWAWSVAAGLIASDLVHHFVVLPLWVGNTGWHWP